MNSRPAVVFEPGAKVGRRELRSIMLPREHGGWSLTLEPALLGLVVAPSVSGLALGAAAVLAFVARTPVKMVLVDIRRRRWLPRTRMAALVSSGEFLVLSWLLWIAVVSAKAPFWWPLVVAAPLIGVELWYGMRSRSRQLVPEWAGSVGIGSVAAAIALAGGQSRSMAMALWLVIGARAFAAVPFVRTQLRRRKGQAEQRIVCDIAQLAAIVAVLSGWRFGEVPLLGVVAVATLSAFHVSAARSTPPKPSVIGAQQVGLGAMVIIATGVGAL